VLSRFSLTKDAWVQWRLPRRLEEISGLALTPDERLLAMDDERGIIYEIDYGNGKLVKAFSLGDPPVRADFEGLAYLDGIVYVITSDGVLYAAAEGAHGDVVDYQAYDTGIGRQCEIEGLAHDDGFLLILCKEGRKGADNTGLSIFAWSTESQELEPSRTIVLPAGEIFEILGSRRLHPSGLAVDPVTGSLVIIAARQRALVELDRDGRLLSAIVLPLASEHEQAEGIEITRNGKLIIADEGGKKRGTIAVYTAKITDPIPGHE
jgi:uncharacterized protein YjiK